MTDFTLHYWSPNQNLERVYAKTLAGDDLGYFEQRATVRQRDPAGTYYDRHRLAKGETTDYMPHQTAWHGAAELRAAILAAIGLDPAADDHLGTNGRLAIERVGMCTLRTKARGFRYAVSGKSSRDKATRERARETEAGNQARAEAVYSFELPAIAE